MPWKRKIYAPTKQKYETRLHELDGELSKAQAELEKVLGSDIYASYLRLEEETGQQGRQAEKIRESWESQIRIAVPGLEEICQGIPGTGPN